MGRTEAPERPGETTTERGYVSNLVVVERLGTEEADLGLRVSLSLDDGEFAEEFVDDRYEDIEAQLPQYVFGENALASWAEAVRARLDLDMAEMPARSNPERYFDDKQLLRTTLETDLEFNTRFHVGHDNRLWSWHEGVYVPDGEAQVHARMRYLMGNKVSVHYINEMRAFVKAGTVTRPLPALPDQRLLNFVNERVDWKTGNTRSHDRDSDLSTLQVPVYHRPGLDCPEVERFFADTFPDDAQDFAWELTGYFLYPRNPLKVAMLLRGPSNTGKSTYLQLLKTWLGVRNCATVSLQYIEEERWGTSALYGKLANIVAELDSRALQTSATFKQIVEGDEVMAEFKGKDTFSFEPFVKMIFSANRPPMTRDQSDAFFGRWLVVPFTKRHVFDPKEAKKQGVGVVDQGLLDRLSAPAEKSGMLNRSLRGLRDLMERGHFDLPASVKAETEAYRQQADSVRRFVAEGGFEVVDRERRENNVKLSKIFADYRLWCEHDNQRPVSKVDFKLQLEENFRGKIRFTGSGGSARVFGLRAREGGAEV